jgi:D-alanyl-lipoteichoic acid acyltransferase DltB (MBOAT superfamily)
MDAAAFLDPSVQPARPNLQQWLTAILKTALGILLLWVLARHVSPELPLVRGWTGLLGLILLLHFGSFHLIALFWQTFGINAQPIMSKPLLSKSLGEFWGKRWNLGFRQLAHEFIFFPLHRRLGVTATGFLVFVLSGLVHDFVISLPARAGYGLPTAYFMIQGIGVAAERSGVGRRLGLQAGVRARIFILILTAGPAFWLFHPPFIMRVIVPFMYAVHSL